jgi:hypothetical protein
LDKIAARSGGLSSSLAVDEAYEAAPPAPERLKTQTLCNFLLDRAQVRLHIMSSILHENADQQT